MSYEKGLNFADIFLINLEKAFCGFLHKSWIKQRRFTIDC